MILDSPDNVFKKRDAKGSHGNFHINYFHECIEKLFNAVDMKIIPDTFIIVDDTKYQTFLHEPAPNEKLMKTHM